MSEYKIVETASGTRYMVYPSGEVVRAGTTPVVGLADNELFFEGRLADFQSYEDLEVRGRLVWYSKYDVVPITSTPIKKIQVEGK